MEQITKTQSEQNRNIFIEQQPNTSYKSPTPGPVVFNELRRPSIGFSSVITIPTDERLPDDFEQLKEEAFEFSLDYPEQYRKSIANNYLCMKASSVYSCKDENISNCDKLQSVPLTCGARYCTHTTCIKKRIGRSMHILNSYGIRSKRLYHFSIGSNRLDKSALQVVIRRYIKAIPEKFKIAYKDFKTGKITPTFPLIKVFDVSNKNYDKYKSYWNHFHIATYGKEINTQELTKWSNKWLQENNTECVFSNFGWRHKKGIFRYFARRNAGQLGHKDNPYFYKDLYSITEYLELYYCNRFLSTQIPEGLTSISEIPIPKILCNCCGSEMYFLCYSVKPINSGGIDDP